MVAPFVLGSLNAVCFPGGSFDIVTKKKCHRLLCEMEDLYKSLRDKALELIHRNAQVFTFMNHTC